jgi:hypothetical protein
MSLPRRPESRAIALPEVGSPLRLAQAVHTAASPWIRIRLAERSDVTHWLLDLSNRG